MKKRRLITEIEQNQIIRRAVYNQIIKSPSQTIAAFAKQSGLSYDTVHSIVTLGKEPKENTIMQLAKGCNQSMAEIYALDTEIVISDPWERQFMLAYRAATMEAKILALKIMQEAKE